VTELHHTVIGSGPPVVLLHGGTGSSDTYWAGQVDELSEIFTLILMDHRGFGRSAKVGEFSVEACAGDVVTILDQYGYEQADLVGLSLGGCIALQAALDSPSRIRRLVLADTFSSVRTERFRRFIDYALIGAVRAGGYDLMSNLNLIFAHGESFLAAQSSGSSPSGQVWQQTEIEAYVDALIKIRDWNVEAHLSQITAPSLIVWGSDDIEVPRQYSEHLANTLPNALMTVIPNAGHKSCTDQPRLFNKVVRTFLASG
jgi:pimeloyl-ACP methyl ester carboxylesterase